MKEDGSWEMYLCLGSLGYALSFCFASNAVNSQGGTGHRDIRVPAARQEWCQHGTTLRAVLTQLRCTDRRGQSTSLGLSTNTNLFSFQSRDGAKQ